MKIKMVVTIMIIAFIVGCEPTPKAKWDSWVEDKEKLGYKVLSVTKSEQWIKDIGSAISMPEKLSFLEQDSVLPKAFPQHDNIVTVDHNGKYRVIGKKILTLYEVKKHRWDFAVKNEEHFVGLETLGVRESDQWIEDNRSKISMDKLKQLRFLESYLVTIPRQVIFITVDYNDKYRVKVMKKDGTSFPGSPSEKSILKVGDTYNVSNFIISHGRNKVEKVYRNVNGAETHTVVFEPGGMVSGTDREGTTSTYTSERGATIHLGVNNIVTKIEGVVYMTKEKL